MDTAQMLHTFARRTCMTRYEYWSGVYSDLAQGGRNRIAFGDYTEEAYAVFPRYNVLQAVLDTIEALDPDALPDVEKLRTLLVGAAQTASSDFTRPMANPIHQRAMAQEREALALIFRSATTSDLAGVEPLFYRRTLGADESRFWRQLIKDAWGADDGYWYPLGEKTHPSLVALDLDGIDESALQARIGRYLRENAIARVVELREDGVSYELEAGAAVVAYNGAEGFWTSDRSEWIIYCSHEKTMTLGGKIAVAIADGAGTI
jgi:hypothetical protein